MRKNQHAQKAPAERAHAKPGQAERRQHQPVRPDRERHPVETDNDEPVLAFGDHMPEFLKRPVRLPPASKEPEAA